ncbi:MAG: phage repressor protein C with HTH and peptisase S24 domain [Polaribacter sp.]|jgi:phage repressor protein C with HTH and peptisase S24 domain
MEYPVYTTIKKKSVDKDNNIVSRRFIKCLEQLKEANQVRSSRQFAMELNYLPQSLSEIIRGRRDVTIELLRKAVERYQFNPVYIYTGEGEYFLSENEQKSFRVLTIVSNSEEDEKIVHVPVPAQSGYAKELANPAFIEQLPTFSLPDYKYKTGTHRSFDVSGDSMEPTLFEGDKVICNYLDPDVWDSGIKDNYVYVLVSRSDVLIRRVKNNIPNNNSLTLLSDNAFYEPAIIPISDLKEVWYVRAKISPFLPSPKNIQNYVREEVQMLKENIRDQTRLIQALQSTLDQMNKRLDK